MFVLIISIHLPLLTARFFVLCTMTENKIVLSKLFNKCKSVKTFVEKIFNKKGSFAFPGVNSSPSLKGYYLSSLAQQPMIHNTNGSQPFRSSKNSFKKNKANIAIAVLVLLVIFAAVFAVRRIMSNIQSASPTSVLSNQTNTPGAKKTMQLNKEFSFPLRDNAGKEVSQIKVSLLNAVLLDEIIIRGRKAKALPGRTFLVVNMKITNDYNRNIQLNIRDYFRLTKNGINEKLAPDIHNDPVEVQASSTKYTRAGFPINSTDKNLILQIGEINGDKQTIQLDFKK